MRISSKIVDAIYPRRFIPNNCYIYSFLLTLYFKYKNWKNDCVFLHSSLFDPYCNASGEGYIGVYSNGSPIEIFNYINSRGQSRISLYLFRSRHFQFNFAARSWFTFHLIAKRREGRSSNSGNRTISGDICVQTVWKSLSPEHRARKAYLRW